MNDRIYRYRMGLNVHFTKNYNRKQYLFSRLNRDKMLRSESTFWPMTQKSGIGSTRRFFREMMANCGVKIPFNKSRYFLPKVYLWIRTFFQYWLLRCEAEKTKGTNTCKKGHIQVQKNINLEWVCFEVIIDSKWIRKANPKRRIILILDNFRSHHARTV